MHRRVKALILVGVILGNTAIGSLEVIASELKNIEVIAERIEKGSIIKDVNLVIAINKSLNKADITAEITQTELEKISILRAENFNIKDLSGLENAVNLQEVYLANNEIMDITPLTALKKISILDISSNKISDISGLEQIVELSRLYLSNNMIGDISVLNGHSKLAILEAQNNNISTINMNNIVALSEINLSDNNLKGILSIQNAGQLTKVIAKNNSLTGFDSNSNVINYIDLSKNDLTTLGSLKMPKSLLELYVQENKITDISQLNGVNLIKLNVANNVITDASVVEDMIELKELNLSGNSVAQSLNISKLAKLEKLELQSIEAGNEVFNAIIELKKNYSTIREVDLEGNKINDISKIAEVENNKFSKINLNKNNIRSIREIKTPGNFVEKENTFTIMDQTVEISEVLEYENIEINVRDIIINAESGVNKDKKLSISQITGGGKAENRQDKQFITWQQKNYQEKFNFKQPIDKAPWGTGTNNDFFTGTVILNITHKASILGLDDKTIEVGGTFNELEGVSLSDDKPTDINNIQVIGNVNTQAVGVYTLTYKYTDSDGNITEKTRTVRVINAGEQIVNIPDENLKKALNSELGNGESTSDITNTELAKLNGKLDLTGKKIVDLEGIQNAVNVTELILSKNEIASVDQLENMTSLIKLKIDNNTNITDISPISKLPKLEILDASYCKITEIGQWNNSKITEIDFSRNNTIQNIDGLSGSQDLKTFKFDYNIVQDISVLADLQSLEVVSGISNQISITGDWSKSNVKDVVIYNNKKLTDVSGFSQATKLNKFYAYSSAVDTLGDWSGSQVTNMNLGNNKITDISNLKNMNKLKSLSLDKNQIVRISNPMVGLDELETLNLFDNPLENADGLFNNLPKLTTVNLNNTKLGSLDFLKGSKLLTTMKIDNINLNDINEVLEFKLLKTITLNYNSISNIEALKDLKDLTTIEMKDNDVENIDALAGLLNLTTVDFTGNKISDITALGALPKLTKITLENNSIYDLTPIRTFNGTLNVKNQDITLKELGVELGRNGVLENPIKNRQGIFTGIKDISRNGTYDSNTNKITWIRPAIGTTETFKFEESNFSGTVKVPIAQNLAPIIVAYDRTFYQGDKITVDDLKVGVSGSDYEDGNITDKITIISNNIPLDSNNIATTIGDYSVVYQLIDNAGTATTKKIKVSILSNSSPKIEGVPHITIKAGDSFDPRDGLKLSDDHDTEAQLLANLVIDDKVDRDNPGTYTVKYTVTDTHGNTAEYIRIVTVRSNDKPVIVANDVTIKVHESINLLTDSRIGLSVSDTEDGENIKNSVSVKDKNGLDVDDPQVGSYKVVYTVTDSDSNTTEKEITVTVRTNDKPVLNANDFTVKEKKKFSIIQMSGATATDTEDGPIDNRIKIKDYGGLSEVSPTIGQYQVVLEVIDNDSNVMEKTITVTVIQNIFTLNYDTKGGSTVLDDNVEFDTLITEPQEPTRTGYTFDGWYKEDTFVTKWDFNTDKMPASNMTLYAKWNINSYTITYDTQDGNTTNEKVEFDSIIKEPQVPLRAGYTFDGWYEDAACITKWDFTTGKMPANNMTLYAKWNINSYKVIYETDGGSAVPEADVNFDELINEPVKPTKEGHTFDGWYTDKILQTKWDFGTGKMPSNDLTLYAKWNINSYKVIYETDGGSSVPEETVVFNNLVTEPTKPAKVGYTFDGWYKEDTFATKWDFTADKMPSSNMRLYAKWSINSYTLTYDTQDGNTKNEQVEFDSIIAKPQDPVRNGYTFAGWYTDSGYASEWDFNSGKMPSSNMTLYAKWSINSYTLTYDTQDGNTKNEQVEFDSTISKPQDPVRDGYTFDGWYTDAACTDAWDFNSDKMPASNVILYAKWNVNSYKVTYETDGGSGVPEADVNFNELIKEPTEPTKVGYTFGGWYTDTNFTTVWDFGNDKMPSSNMTLYAKWSINSYTLTYDTQDGNTKNEQVEFDSTISKPQDPVRDGYTFNGWYTDTSYANAWDFNAGKMPSSNMTLYAKWDINSYKVTYESNGGTAVSDVNVNFDGLLIKPQEPTRTGYSFNGWYTDATLATPWNFDTDKMPASDITLYAKWTINSYKVLYDSQGGSAVEEETVNFDNLLIKPTEPTKIGYIFEGWYVDETYTTQWNFDLDKMPANNITLYAKWRTNKPPVIKGADNKTIKVGEVGNFDLREGIIVEDNYDTITSDQVIIEGSLGIPQAGTNEDYEIKYKVIDSDGNETVATRIITVTNGIPNISGLSDVIIKEGTKFDIISGVYARDDEDGDISNKIIFPNNNLEKLGVGKHKLIYKVTDSDGNITTKERSITVLKNEDTYGNKVIGKDIKLDQIVIGIGDVDTFDKLAGVNTDGFKSLRIEGEIEKPSSNQSKTSIIKYIFTDMNGENIIVERLITVTNYAPVIYGLEKIVIKQSEEYDLKKGVVADDFEDGIISNNIEYPDINVSELEIGTNFLEYKVSDSDGNVTTSTREIEVIGQNIVEEYKELDKEVKKKAYWSIIPIAVMILLGRKMKKNHEKARKEDE